MTPHARPSHEQGLGGHLPQSAAHVAQDSPLFASHKPSPHLTGQAPQSLGQLLQLSPSPSQAPSPQLLGQGPQSWAHLSHVSLASQLPLPQTAGQAPQSLGQL